MQKQSGELSNLRSESTQPLEYNSVTKTSVEGALKSLTNRQYKENLQNFGNEKKLLLSMANKPPNKSAEGKDESHNARFVIFLVGVRNSTDYYSSF